MAASKEQILDWLSYVPDTSPVWIDDGGRCLRAEGDEGEELYYELGGFPDDDVL